MEDDTLGVFAHVHGERGDGTVDQHTPTERATVGQNARAALIARGALVEQAANVGDIELF